MLRFIKILINAKYNFLPPSKKNILIYDHHSKEIIGKIFNIKKTSFLSTRKENINLYILFRTLLEFKFQHINYVINYIKHVNPKLLITAIDNDKNFYIIKNFIPKLITIFIQNGQRTAGNGDIFTILKNKKLSNYKKLFNVDLMCVFNQMTSEFYKKFITGKTYISGSVKNNCKKIYHKKKGLLYISLHRPQKQPLDLIMKLKHKREKKILQVIDKFCITKNLNLKILGKHINIKAQEDEKKYYESILGKQFTFIGNTKNRNTYKYLDNSEIIVSSGSTMFLESLARKNKTAIMHSFPNKECYWGYHTKRKIDGFFWTNDLTEKKIFKVLNNLKKISKYNWQKKLKKFEYETCAYDYKNMKLKKMIKKTCYNHKFNVTPFLI